MQLTRMKCEQAVIRVKFRVDFIIILIDVFRIHILIKLTRRKFTKNSPYLLCCVFLSVQLINFIDIVFFFLEQKMSINSFDDKIIFDFIYMHS